MGNLVVDVAELSSPGERGVTRSENAGDSGGSDRVVEVLVVIEPLAAEIVLTRVLERGIDWGKILGSTHR